MPERRFDAIFCDVDGCLMPEAIEPADLASLTAIAEWNRRAGTHEDRPAVIPCTGRPQPFCEAVCRIIGATAYPAICEHGVWIYDFATNRWTMSPDISEGDLAAVRDLEAWVNASLGDQGCYLQLGKSAAVTVFHDDVDWLARVVVPMLETLIADRGWPFRVSMTWTCINVDLNHVDKGRAIDRIMAEHGLTRDRVAGIGDTAGDIAIRERVAWFACPSNASEEIKQHADFVAGAAEAVGVLEILEQLM